MKEYIININGNEYKVVVNSVMGNKADVIVDGVSYQAEFNESFEPLVQASVVGVSKLRPTADAPVQKSAAVQTGAGTYVKAPLPGVIISVNVKLGDVVKVGQVVAVLEAMKMENDILAEVSGIVSGIHVSAGDSVLEATHLITIG